MLQRITGNFWGGAGAVPDTPTIYFIGGISDTTIRITPGFAGHAAYYEVWRADVMAGPYTLIGTIQPQNTFYDDSTLSAGQEAWYELRAVAGTQFSPFSSPATAITLSAEGIEINLWQNLVNYLQADVALSGYIQTFKFDKEAKILLDSNYPVLKGWVMKTTEMWVGMPKQKFVKLHFALHGLVGVRDEVALEREKLNMSTRIKNALERAGMDINGMDTLNLVGDTIFNNLDSYRAEVFVQAEIWSVRFTAGNR